MATFFSKADPKFVSPAEDGTIQTKPFLDAAKQIVPFFDVLGTAFKPVKSDIDGNVIRLRKKYDSDPAKFSILRSILEDEVARNCAEKSDSSTQGLLWLKRALEYITLFLRLIAEDHQSGAKTENMGPFARKAYEETLKKYHGWIVQKVFGVVSMAVPWRKDFLKALNVDKNSPATDDKIVSDMLEYVEQVEVNLKVIQSMFTEMNLDFQTKV